MRLPWFRWRRLDVLRVGPDEVLIIRAPWEYAMGWDPEGRDPLRDALIKVGLDGRFLLIYGDRPLDFTAVKLEEAQ